MDDKRLWFVNGIGRKSDGLTTEMSGIGMLFSAASEAEALGLAHKGMAEKAPKVEVARLWAQDITETCRQFFATPSKEERDNQKGDRQ